MQGIFSDNIPKDDSFLNDKFGKIYLFKIDKSTQKALAIANAVLFPSFFLQPASVTGYL